MFKDEHTSRMKMIKEELSDLKDRVSFKHKRLDAAQLSKNYKLCDQLSEEVAELNKSKRLLELEMGILERKESRSQRYYKRKVKKGKLSKVPCMSAKLYLVSTMTPCLRKVRPPSLSIVSQMVMIRLDKSMYESMYMRQLKRIILFDLVSL